MKFVGVARIRPSFSAYSVYCRRIQATEIGGLLNAHIATRLNCQRPTLLSGRIVEKGIRLRGEYFLCERRRAGQLSADNLDVACLNLLQ